MTIKPEETLSKSFQKVKINKKMTILGDYATKY